MDRSEVVAMAAELMQQHLPAGGWTFGFDAAKRRAGCCDWAKRRITVSRHLLADAGAEDVRQVLLHEIAHALAGHRAAHGPGWKRAAARIGYTGSRLYDGPALAAAPAWIGTCPSGHEHRRFRRPSGPSSCARCSRTFTPSALITWRRPESRAAGSGGATR